MNSGSESKKSTVIKIKNPIYYSCTNFDNEQD